MVEVSLVEFKNQIGLQCNKTQAKIHTKNGKNYQNTCIVDTKAPIDVLILMKIDSSDKTCVKDDA